MESINSLLTQLGAGVVAVTLLAVIVLLAALWLITRRKLAQTALLLAEKENELRLKGRDRDQLLTSAQAQVSRLKERIQVLNEHTYITEFDPDRVYTLTAKAQAEIDAKPICFGLVREDDRNPAPFVTAHGLGELEVGDRFSFAGGRVASITRQTSSASREGAPVSPRVATDDLQYKTEGTITEGLESATMLVRPGCEPISTDDYFKGLPYLKVTEGKDRGALFYLPFTQCKIGRDRANTVSLNDELSSRTHALIEYLDHGFLLRDNQSTNGTYHNGGQVDEARLNFGDTITIGNTSMVFTCEGYELREKSPEEAIALFEKCLCVEPNFITGLKYLAFLLERDVRRKGESEPIYARLKRLEKSS